MSLKKGARLIISYFAYSFFRCDSEDNLTPEERKELLAIQAIGDGQRHSGKFDLRGTVFNVRERVAYERIAMTILMHYIIYSANFDNVHLSTREK